MVYGSATVLVALPIWRMFFAGVVSKALGSQRVLFLGTSQAVREIIAQLAERPDLGMSAIGFLDSPEDRRELRWPQPPIPAPGRWSGRRRCPGTLPARSAAFMRWAQLRIWSVSSRPIGRTALLVGMTERRKRLPVEQLLHLRFSGIHIEEAAITFEHVFHRVSTRDLRPSQLCILDDRGRGLRAWRCKACIRGFWARSSWCLRCR